MKERFEVVVVDEPGEERMSRLSIRHDGREVFFANDCGEPEDQTLLRDWAWVQDAIRLAYDLGRADAEVSVRDVEITAREAVRHLRAMTGGEP